MFSKRYKVLDNVCVSVHPISKTCVVEDHAWFELH